MIVDFFPIGIGFIALGISGIFFSAFNAMSRNKEVASQVSGMAFAGAAMIEFLAFIMIIYKYIIK